MRPEATGDEAQARRAVRRGAALLALAGVVGAAVGALALRPADAAPYWGDGYYRFQSQWDYGPNDDLADPDHTAYYGAPLDSINGAWRVPTNAVGGQWLSDDPDQWADMQITTREISLSGITGGTATFGTFDGGTFTVRCTSPDLPGGSCSVPAREFTLTLRWEISARSGPCMHEWRWGPPPTGALDEECPRQTHTGTSVRRVVAGAPPGSTTTTTEPVEAPVPAFEATATDDDPSTFTFTNQTTDDEDDLEDMTYEWDFGDDETSTEVHPTHRYRRAGTYTVTLTAIDGDGARDSTTREVVVPGGLVVNSTGDAAAEDPEERGCDTGARVGDEAECTLRAAIEAAEAEGGGAITFAIDGAGVPRIALGAPLPAITAPTSVDGTTQPGGFVEVVGGGARVVELAGGTSQVIGLVLDEAAVGVAVTGGSGHRIAGNRFGTDAAATTAGDLPAGVVVTGATGVVVADNVSAAVVGVAGSTGSTGLTVTGNRLGVGPDGSTPLGDPRAGVVVLAADATVSGNVARGETGGLIVLGAAASGATISDNHTGMGTDGTALAGTGYGIRVDAAAGATITGNHVASAGAEYAVVVSGSAQYSVDPGGEVQLGAPSDDVAPGAATGGSATVTGNVVGVPGGDARGGGILTWAGATSSTIEGNTVVGLEDAAVEVRDGAGHRITGNDLGTAASPVGRGVVAVATTDTAIGGPADAANAVVATEDGIAVEAADRTRVEGNDLTTAGDGDGPTGIAVDGDSTATTVVANRVTGATTGIQAEGDGGVVEANVVGEGGDGIVVAGAGVAVRGNRVGVAAGSDAVVGNDGTGIAVTTGDAQVSTNVVAGSGGDGIDVRAGARATLRANRIWDSVGDPIVVADGPDTPVLAAAVLSPEGAAPRTTLLLTDLPEGDAGTIEVFADDTCTPGEARHLMGITRVKDPDETARIIQIEGPDSRAHLTVTYTDADGRTSALSDCRTEARFGDADGDGSVTPFDELLDRADDPTSAVIPTDEEQLLVLSVAPFDEGSGEGGGVLEGAGAVDDPDPGSHPAGWTLPYGAVGFRVSGLEPGGRTRVAMTTLAGDDVTAGTGYWKHGPPTPGAAEAWFPFSYDEATRTGATAITVDLPGLGLRRAFGLQLADGLRGDSDGGANGTITDPGGPVRGAPEVVDPEPPPGSVPVDPPASVPVDPPTAGPADPPAARGPGAPVAAGPTGTDIRRDGLARTGTDLRAGVQAALVLVALGATLVLVARRRVRVRPRRG